MLSSEMDNIDKVSHASAVPVFQDLPSPESFGKRVSSVDSPKVPDPDKSVVSARLSSSSSSCEASSSGVSSANPSSSSATAADQNQQGKTKRKTSNPPEAKRKSQQGSVRPQKQKSAQPRHRHYIKQNPREKELKQTQELYYELLQSLYPSEQYECLERILEQQEDEDARDKFLEQYAEKFQKEEVSVVKQEAEATEQDQPSWLVEERLAAVISVLLQHFGTDVMLFRTDSSEESQGEQTSLTPQLKDEPVQDVLDEFVKKSSPEKPAPPEPSIKVLDEGVFVVGSDPKVVETSEILKLKEARQQQLQQQQQMWNNYLATCTQSQALEAYLPRDQVEEWRRKNQRELLMLNANLLMQKQQTEQAVRLGRPPQTPNPEKSQPRPQQSAKPRKRSRKALDSSALKTPDAKRVATATPDEEKRAAELRDLLKKPEQREELLKRLNVEEVIDALVEHKKKSKRCKQKPLAISDFIKPDSIHQPEQQQKPQELQPKEQQQQQEQQKLQQQQERQQKPHELQETPLDLVQRRDKPLQSPLELAEEKEQDESQKTRPTFPPEVSAEMAQEQLWKLSAEMNLQRIRDQYHGLGQYYATAPQFLPFPLDIARPYGLPQQIPLQLANPNEQYINALMHAQMGIRK